MSISKQLLLSSLSLLLAMAMGCGSKDEYRKHRGGPENASLINNSKDVAKYDSPTVPVVEPYSDVVPAALLPALPAIPALPLPVPVWPPVGVVDPLLDEGDDDDEVGYLTLVKKVEENDNFPSDIDDFGITINTSVTLDFTSTRVGNLTTYTSQELALNDGLYAIKELASDFYTEGDWNCGEASAGPYNDGKVALQSGEHVTCTITNTAPEYVVGYYEMCSGQGASYEVPPIVSNQGFGAINITELTSNNLDKLDILFVTNCDNDLYSSDYIDALADIDAWVFAGGRLVIHDRFVDGAEGILPAGGSFDIIRNFDDPANIDVLDDTTLVTHGPAGVIDNSSLDDGSYSSHGYSVLGTLPGDGVYILTRTDQTQIVTFSYCYGSGGVVYSSIPLDYYLDTFDDEAPYINFRTIYAPNVVNYAALAPQLCI